MQGGRRHGLIKARTPKPHFQDVRAIDVVVPAVLSQLGRALPARPDYKRLGQDYECMPGTPQRQSTKLRICTSEQTTLSVAGGPQQRTSSSTWKTKGCSQAWCAVPPFGPSGT